MSHEMYKDILLEIAFSISGEFQLAKLLGNCLPIFLRKLNCTFAGVVSTSHDGLQTELVLPKAIQNDPLHRQLITGLATGLAQNGQAVFHTLEHTRAHSYGISLDTFGFLMLGRAKAFEPYFLNELLPLARMLGRACRSCGEVQKRRQAESDLERQNKIIDAIIDHAPIGIWLTDPQQNLLRVNHYFQSNTGLGTLDSSLTPQELQICVQTDQEALASPAPVYCEEQITFKSESLLSVINDILDFSRIEAGKLTLALQDFDLEQEIHRLMNILAGQAREKELELLINYDVQAPRRVHGDNLRLRQILFNLGGNAVKFTARGHVLLEVSCLKRDTAAACLRIAVQDTGMGIPPAKLEEIFEHFTQADYSSTRNFGGTGLGLAISRQLVRMMGGEIKVDSTEGQGSRFYFELELPLARDEVVSDTPLKLKHQYALVVDDHPINRRILAEYLKHWEIDHVAAESGEAALEILAASAREGRSFDLAIIDYAMPGMDGLELARRIKQDPRWRDMVLIALSSFWGHIGADVFYANGFATCQPKPINRSDLQKSLVTCLQGPATLLTTAKPPAHSASLSAPLKDAPPVCPDLKILLAEDHPINRKAVMTMLAALTTRVQIATNGQEAYELFTQHAFDLILMDVQMPVMDGLEATRRIREYEASGVCALAGKPEAFETSRQAAPVLLAALQPVPIIALTANAMAGDREKCLAAGMTDYLAKPVRKAELLNTIHKVLATDAASASTTRPAPAQPNQATDAALPGNGPDFNEAEFLTRYDHDLEIAADIMQDFRTEAPQMQKQIEDAFAQREAGALARGAHKLKGAAGYVGADQIRGLCERIMQSTREGQWAAIQSSCEGLSDAVNRFNEQARLFLVTRGDAVKD